MRLASASISFQRGCTFATVVRSTTPALTSEGTTAAVGPEVETIEPGEKVLFPREAGYEVRLTRSAYRVRILKREDLLARIHD